MAAPVDDLKTGKACRLLLPGVHILDNQQKMGQEIESSHSSKQDI